MCNQSLRVIHVLSGDLWAGAEVMVYHLLRGLNSIVGCHVLVVVLNDGQVAERLREEGIQVEVLDETRLSFTRLVIGLRRIIKNFQPCIVHSHRYKENILAYLSSRTGKGISLVATQHGMPEGYGKPPTLKSRLIRRMNFSFRSKGFDRLVAVSQEMKAALGGNGFDQHKIPVILNGIELPQYHPRTRPSGKIVVGSCGRLFPVKNFGLLVEIAARVASQATDMRFELAGDGPLMGSLQLQCKQNRLDAQFFFRGHVQDMDVFYQELDLFVSTSLHEGIPMSVLEAMGHGLPVVAPKVGGFPEIVDHKEDGFLIPEHDPDLFAQACLQLQADPDLLARMSRAARKKAEARFSVQRMVVDYHRLYEELAC